MAAPGLGMRHRTLFADATLAARIERAECRLLADTAAAAARRRSGSTAFVRGIAGGVATYTGPESPLNKLFGLGFAGPLGEDDLAGVERAFLDRGVRVQAEVASLADPAIGELLTRRGYLLKSVENVLGRPLTGGGEGEIRAGIDVSIGEPTTLPAWLDVMVTAIAHPDAQGVPTHETFSRDVLERPLADMAEGQGFVRYHAYRDGLLAGGAGLRLAEGVALLCGAATLPEHRRHGVQTALLARRLADAAGAGCDIAVVTVQPGSKSQQNVERRGFALLYTRAIPVREG
jgi:GNAT superfamily N-acetyltransferase